MNHHFRLHSGLLSLTALLCLAQPGISQVPHLLHHQGRVAVDGVNFNGTGQFKFALVDAGTDVSRQATATPVISNGYLTGVTVTDGGAGYASAPTATAKDIKTGGGSGARLQCTVSGGAVTGITVVDPGAAYTGFTTIQISAPPPSIVYQTWWGNAADTTPADGEPDAAITLTVTNGLFDVLLGDTTLANMAAVPASVFSNPDVRLRVWFDDGSHGFQQLSPDKRIAAVGYAVMADTVPDGATTREKIAAGAVQSSNIDAGAVTSTKLATGAVQAANIAPGTITATQLAKPPRSGSIASSSLQFDFNQATFTVPFSP
ncbi:MAG: hypothetical protein K9M97_14470, partial [Akkermansiaceae bacterium]|nr:hypothetical protein [Akkermansiaceae bacterium]